MSVGGVINGNADCYTTSYAFIVCCCVTHVASGTQMATRVILFLPNIIEYIRIALVVCACCHMSHSPGRASVLYLSSVVLDELDGLVARMLEQESKFGEILDMVVDRLTTTCLCARLCQLYPDHVIYLQAFMVLDIASHWLHMYGASMHPVFGTQFGAHKKTSTDPILQLYYTNEVFLRILSHASEWFLCMLYMCRFTEGRQAYFGLGLWRLIMYGCSPFALLKAAVSLIQLFAACQTIGNADGENL